jgi:hypothetical protein
MQKVKKNSTTYKALTGVFLAGIVRMNLKANEYLSLRLIRYEHEREKISA